MEIQTEPPPAPSTELPAIVAVSEVIAVNEIPDDVRLLAERRQRTCPASNGSGM